LRQDPDEPFRTFAARVQGKAETCEFKTAFNGVCTGCNAAFDGTVYYTDEVIRDVLLNGVADNEIRCDALSTDGIQMKPVTDVIAFVENKETARNANPSTTLSALSAYRRNNSSQYNKDASHKLRRNRGSSPSDAEKLRTAVCPGCSKSFQVFSRKARGWNRKPHVQCESCWKRNRNMSHNKQSGEAGSISLLKDTLGQLSSITTTPTPSSLNNSVASHDQSGTTLDDQI